MSYPRLSPGQTAHEAEVAEPADDQPPVADLTDQAAIGDPLGDAADG